MIWMLVRELFEDANKNDYTDLQALVLFLVFEKGVISMDDDTNKLDLYFLEKHNDRMNKELRSYKQKMNMKYKPQVYEIKPDKGQYVYIYAHNEQQAKFIANKNLIKVNEIRVCDLDELLNLNGKDMTARTIIQNKQAPSILGGF